MSQTTITHALAEAWGLIDSDPERARHMAESFLGTAPSDAVLLMAASLRRLGQVPEARKLLAPIIAQQPRAAVVWFEWAMIQAEWDAWEDAAASLRRAVGARPRFAGAWRALGDQLVLLREYDAAHQAYAGATAATIRDPLLLPAADALNAGEAAEAERMLKPIVRARPADLQANQLLAEAAVLLRKVPAAEATLIHCLQLAPDLAPARHRLATLLYSYGGFREAIPHLDTLLRLLPHQPSLKVMLTESLGHGGNFAAALPLYEAMTRACPRRPIVALAYAHALKLVGREAESADAYRAYLAVAGRYTGRIWLSLMDLRTIPATDADIDGMRAALANPAEADLPQANMALGRALEQRGDYAGAFAHYARGAALRRAEVAYDADATTAFVEASKSVFTTNFFQERSGSGSLSGAPIFIVGMPRSGSTLVEQILASHPMVEGTMELREMGLIAAALRGDRPQPELPGIILGLEPARFAQLGERYVAASRQYRHLDRPRFTDKTPDNFLRTGLIHLMLPNARIIDVRRDPMACGMAVFRQYFQDMQEAQAFTNDFGEIGRYYRDYVTLMDHFDDVLPGVVFHLSYENLVRDTETQVRALLDYCGLPFDEACLRFWETERSVQTPSAQQVRQPIFREGLEEWRNYEPWLGKLREALEG